LIKKDAAYKDGYELFIVPLPRINNESIMAITIKSIPVLEGKTAEEFVRRAEKNAILRTPSLSKTEADRLQTVLDKSKRFKFQ
jgi:hypothetical protein